MIFERPKSFNLSWRIKGTGSAQLESDNACLSKKKKKKDRVVVETKIKETEREEKKKKSGTTTNKTEFLKGEKRPPEFLAHFLDRRDIGTSY